MPAKMGAASSSAMAAATDQGLSMKILRKLMLTGVFALPMPSYASPPMRHESIQVITAALPQCTGGWFGPGSRGRVAPMDLAPRLQLLSRPSSTLDEDAGRDLYEIAKGLLASAIGPHDGMLDGDASLNCPARPEEAVALLEYLVDEEPDAWRGATNAFEWLGLAYETGAAGTKNAARARRYYLRFRIHTGIGSEARWSDGIDHDLVSNVSRAGLRPYFDALARSERGGGAARLTLAEMALSTDPETARKWLRYLDDRLLVRLLELEQQKRIPSVANAEEVLFWAEAARTLFGYRKYAARMLSAARDLNGGDIPTSPERPSIDLLRSHLDMAAVADTDATREPIPVRALVTPDGRAIYIEACTVQPARSVRLDVLNVQLNAARLYSLNNLAGLPKLPITKKGSKPTYGWVILPAVHFTRPDTGKLDIHFADLPAARCRQSSIANAPLMPIAR
jgi:hypothetical protein